MMIRFEKLRYVVLFTNIGVQHAASVHLGLNSVDSYLIVKQESRDTIGVKTRAMRKVCQFGASTSRFAVHCRLHPRVNLAGCYASR